MITIIAENANSHVTNRKWIWACCELLADWAGEKPWWGTAHKERLEKTKNLPIITVNGHMKTVVDLQDPLVTWKPDADVGNLPNWLPLSCVDDWFGDSFQDEAEKNSPVKKLSRELGIMEPGTDVNQRRWPSD